MRIGLLGSGEVGRTVAAGLAAVGHEVVLGTRDLGGRFNLRIVREA